MKMTHPLENLRDQVDDLATLPPQDAATAWLKLRAGIDAICQDLQRGDPETVRTTLPLLAEIITRLDQVIAQMQEDAPRG